MSPPNAPDPSGAARAPQTTDELVAEVKAALANPLSKHAPDFVLNYRAWLGALVQAVEDQQRRLSDAEKYGASRREEAETERARYAAYVLKNQELERVVAQLRADGQRLREILEPFARVGAIWLSREGGLLSEEVYAIGEDDWKRAMVALAPPGNAP